MKEDLKNVIITFGLVAFVFTGGFFTYREKKIQENILAIKQELQKIENEKLLKIEANRVLQEELLITKNIQDQKARDKALLKQNQAELSHKQALAIQQQQAQAQANAQAQALQQQQAQQAQAQASTPAVVKPSRQSRAS